ncbi:5491_t:CDS:1, partial [Funneliformis geosporum]
MKTVVEIKHNDNQNRSRNRSRDNDNRRVRNRCSRSYDDNHSRVMNVENNWQVES